MKGRITDTKGEPLIGATVAEAGTTNGTITDVNGNFTLKLSKSNSILNITYIGFKPQTILVKDRSEINISLDYKPSEKLALKGSTENVRAENWEFCINCF